MNASWIPRLRNWVSTVIQLFWRGCQQSGVARGEGGGARGCEARCRWWVRAESVGDDSCNALVALAVRARWWWREGSGVLLELRSCRCC